MKPTKFVPRPDMVYLLIYENGESDRLTDVCIRGPEDDPALRDYWLGFYFYFDRGARVRIEDIQHETPTEMRFIGVMGGSKKQLILKEYAPRTEEPVHRHESRRQHVRTSSEE